VSKKTYDGYRSFSYLTPGEDYQDIPLAKDVDRVPSAKVELSAAEEERARAILDGSQIVSMHDHTSIFPEDMGRVLEQRRQGRDATGYAGLAISDTDIVFENFMDGTATITSNKGWKWDDILLFDLGMRFSDIDHQGMVYIATTYLDLTPREGSGTDRVRAVARGGDGDRERDRSGRRALRVRRAGHGHHLQRGEHPRLGSA
jgi:membrane dipeptidase